MILKRKTILLLILFVGCTSRPTSKEITVDIDAKKALVQKLDGYWLSNNYLINVSNSKSIYKSRDYKTRFWGFTLDKSNLMTNSASINGFTEHEGGYTCSITFDSTKNCFIKDLERNKGYSSVKESFTMTVLDNGLLQLDFGDFKEEYRKVVDDQTELRKILFQGRFKDLGTNATIEFSADGKINGFDKETYFELAYDFGEGFFYDVGIFYPNKDSSGIWTRGELFHFKINTDTVKLFRITPDWEGLEHKIGDIKHVLVKS